MCSPQYHHEEHHYTEPLNEEYHHDTTHYPTEGESESKDCVLRLARLGGAKAPASSATTTGGRPWNQRVPLIKPRLRFCPLLRDLARDSCILAPKDTRPPPQRPGRPLGERGVRRSDAQASTGVTPGARRNRWRGILHLLGHRGNLRRGATAVRTGGPYGYFQQTNLRSWAGKEPAHVSVG